MTRKPSRYEPSTTRPDSSSATATSCSCPSPRKRCLKPSLGGFVPVESCQRASQTAPSRGAWQRHGTASDAPEKACAQLRQRELFEERPSLIGHQELIALGIEEAVV